MIGDDLFAGTIENWLKEIRNLNGFVMLALQEIEDGQGSKLRSVIEQQCKTKIFLPNPAARAEHTRQAYTALGITPAQIQQNAQGKLYVNASPSDARFSDLFQGDEIGDTAYVVTLNGEVWKIGDVSRLGHHGHGGHRD